MTWTYLLDRNACIMSTKTLSGMFYGEMNKTLKISPLQKTHQLAGLYVSICSSRYTIIRIKTFSVKRKFVGVWISRRFRRLRGNPKFRWGYVRRLAMMTWCPKVCIYTYSAKGGNKVSPTLHLWRCSVVLQCGGGARMTRIGTVRYSGPEVHRIVFPVC